MAVDAPVRVVIVTMDSHLSSAALRAERELSYMAGPEAKAPAKRPAARRVA